MSQILLKIKSKYNLKEIFLPLDYNHILKLIKNNNELKKSLDIDISNYKQRSNYRYLERKKVIKKIPYENKSDEADLYILYKMMYSMAFALILFIYTIIFASVLAAKGAFNEKNIKKNSYNDIAILIKKINLSLFGFAAYIIVSFIIGLAIMGDCQIDFLITKAIKIFIIIILLIIFLGYDILIIVKLILSHKIKKSIITWFIIGDYLLIILISLYLAYIIYISYLYFSFVIENKCQLIKEREMILKKFRDLKINDFMLPEDFNQKNDYEKRKFILNNKNKYEIIGSSKQKDLITLINKIRFDNNVDDLIYEVKINYQELIFDRCSEPFLFSNKNIFKFYDGSYLLKYPLHEFITKLNKRDFEITNIILSNYLNKIFIIKKDNMEYIFLFQSKNIPLISQNHYDYDNDDTINEINLTVKEEGVYTVKSFFKDYKYYDC